MSTQDDNVYATVLRLPVSCEIARDRVIFRLTGGASLRRKAVAEAEKPNQFPWTESCPARPFNQRASPACAQTPHPRPASSRPGNPRPEPPAAARSPSPGEFLGTARLVPPAPESAPEPEKTELVVLRTARGTARVRACRARAVASSAFGKRLHCLIRIDPHTCFLPLYSLAI